MNKKRKKAIKKIFKKRIESITFSFHKSEEDKKYGNKTIASATWHYRNEWKNFWSDDDKDFFSKRLMFNPAKAYFKVRSHPKISIKITWRKRF